MFFSFIYILILITFETFISQTQYEPPAKRIPVSNLSLYENFNLHIKLAGNMHLEFVYKGNECILQITPFSYCNLSLNFSVYNFFFSQYHDESR